MKNFSIMHSNVKQDNLTLKSTIHFYQSGILIDLYLSPPTTFPLNQGQDIVSITVLSLVVQRLKAKIQRNRANCDKSGKFRGDVFKIMYFQFFTSSSKFCSEKGEIYHF